MSETLKRTRGIHKDLPSIKRSHKYIQNETNDRVKSIESIDEVTNVISDKKWKEFKERSIVTFKSIEYRIFERVYSNLYKMYID